MSALILKCAGISKRKPARTGAAGAGAAAAAAVFPGESTSES